MSSRISEGLLQGTLNPFDGLSPGVEASIQASHIDSFRNGTAFSMARGKWQSQGNVTEFFTLIGFAGTLLAWLDLYAGSIKLKCVVSGQEVIVYTPTGWDVRQIAISDTSLVATSRSGKLCAWDLSFGIRHLEGQTPECIKTGAARLHSLFLSGKLVAAYCYDGDETIHFTTWDIKGRQSYQFLLETIPNGHHLVLIPSDGKSIVFFQFHSPEQSVHFRRMNLKGRIESSGYIELPDLKSYSMHHSISVYSCTTVCNTLWSFARRKRVLFPQQSKGCTLEIVQLVYDTKTDRLELQMNTVEDSIQTRVSASDIFGWRDVVYFHNPLSGLGELEIIDLKASVCKKAEMSVSTEVSETPLDNERCGSDCNPSLLLGNESFLVHVRYVYLIYCFCCGLLHVVEYFYLVLLLDFLHTMLIL